MRERAVRLVFEQLSAHESEWAAIGSIAGKMGRTAETLRKWVRQAERDAGKRGGLTTAERDPWRNIDPVEYATLEWVDWFNTRGGSLRRDASKLQLPCATSSTRTTQPLSAGLALDAVGSHARAHVRSLASFLDEAYILPSFASA